MCIRVVSTLLLTSIFALAHAQQNPPPAPFPGTPTPSQSPSVPQQPQSGYPLQQAPQQFPQQAPQQNPQFPQQQFPQQPGLPMPNTPAQNGPITLPHQGNLPNDPSSKASRRLLQLPTVTIREFRSSVQEVTPRGATDMFMTALVNTRKFRVVERARLAEGIAAEKALNQSGTTTGQSGQSKYASATYMFEGTVSEASTGEAQKSMGINVMGAGANKSSSTDTIAIDVRLIDVESGTVIDAQTVRKKMLTVESKAGGILNALGGHFLKGAARDIAQNSAPIDQISSARKDSVDKALREAIEEAINEITKSGLAE